MVVQVVAQAVPSVAPVAVVMTAVAVMTVVPVVVPMVAAPTVGVSLPIGIAGHPGRSDGAAHVTAPRGSQKLRLLQEFDRLGAGPELGNGDGVGLQLVERRLWLRGRDP
jgi:hypothetical protein